jgi:DNA-3-methyladenine glycosylase II
MRIGNLSSRIERVRSCQSPISGPEQGLVTRSSLTARFVMHVCRICVIRAHTLFLRLSMSTVALPFDHREAIRFLMESDPHLAQLIEKAREFGLNIDEQQTPYESLLRAIVYQSISGKAAAVIFSRIRALGSNGRCPTPDELLRVRTPALRKAGLSAAKIAAVRDLAQKTIEGVVPDLETAHSMSDEELVRRLISVRGIGAWTVEMFLIFRLGRPDVLPIHDYGVQKGFAITYRKRKIPTPRELAKFGERWRPYRTVASWYLWRAIDLAGKDARKITKSTKTRLKVKVKRVRTRQRQKKIPTRK